MLDESVAGIAQGTYWSVAIGSPKYVSARMSRLLCMPGAYRASRIKEMSVGLPQE